LILALATARGKSRLSSATRTVARPSICGRRGPEGGIYTSHGLMTGADLDEYRRDTDWHELHRPVPEADQCEHARFWTDDCDDCRRPMMVDEIREALTDGESPIYLADGECRGVLRELLGAGTVNEAVLDALRSAVESALKIRQRRAAELVRQAAADSECDDFEGLG
jgi:hypothetical protein